MASRVLATIISMKNQFTGPARQVASSTKNINREVKRTINEVKKFGAEMKKTAVEGAKSFAKWGTAGAGLMAGFAAKTSLTEAMDLEGFRLTLETVTKDAKKAKDLLSWGSDFANATPFETKDIIEGITKLQSYGLEAKKVLPAVGDMSAVMGKSLEQGVEAIADAQAGELERMKEFGITKDMIIKQAQKLRLGLVVNQKGQIVDQQKFNKAMFSLMNDKFADGMKKQAGTMKGIWSTITGVTKSALADVIGITKDGSIRQGSIYETLKIKVQSVGDTLTKWQSDGTITRISNDVTAAVKIMISIFKEVFSIISGIYNFFKNNWSTIGPLIMTIVVAVNLYKAAMIASAIYTSIFAIATNGAAVATGVLRAVFVIAEAAQWGYLIAMQSGSVAAGILAGAQWALNAAMTANPIAVVIAGIAALVAVGILVYKNWGNIKKVALSLWESIKKLWDVFSKSPFGKVAIEAFKLLTPFDEIAKVGGMVMDIFNKIFKGKGSWEQIGKEILKLLNPIEQLKTAAKFIGELFGGKKETKVAVKTIQNKETAVKTQSTVKNVIKNTGLKKFAKGGVATKASIFGEAGPEIAIPLNGSNRSKDLLNYANNTINKDSGSNRAVAGQDKKVIQFIFNGDVYGFEDFKEVVAKVFCEIYKIDGANVAVTK